MFYFFFYFFLRPDAKSLALKYSHPSKRTLDARSKLACLFFGSEITPSYAIAYNPYLMLAFKNNYDLRRRLRSRSRVSLIA